MEKCIENGVCKKFPFCEEEPEECNKFNKREYEMKLVDTDGVSFKFEKI